MLQVLFLLLAAGCCSAAVTPLIIIPGFTSSTIQYRMQNAEGINPHCYNSTPFNSWQQLWPLTLPEVVSEPLVECTVFHMRVVYDPTTDTFSNPPGIDTRIPNFGSFSNFNEKSSPFWFTLVSNLTQAGWVQDKDLFVAPFDWRLLGSRMTDFHNQLKTLVEQVYATNNNRKVALAAVSEGPQITLAFLQAMTQEWRTQYIDWFIAMSPVWSGAPLLMFTLSAGLNITQNMPVAVGQRIVTGTPGALWLMPRAGTDSYTFPRDEPIIMTPSKNYSAYDYANLLRDLDLGDFVDEVNTIVQDPVLADFAHPGVNTFVAYGFGLPTPDTLTFPADFDPTNGTLLTPSNSTQSSGDTLVPYRSSLRSLGWLANMTSAGLKLLQKGYINQPHAACLFTPGECYNDVVQLLVNGTMPSNGVKSRAVPSDVPVPVSSPPALGHMLLAKPSLPKA